MSLYETSVPQFSKMLSNLERWLDKAVSHAAAKSFDPEVYLSMRLAPDQYALVRQIQAACDAAKFAVAYLTGKTAPRHPDTEQTIAEIRARIHSVLEYLKTFEAKEFEGAETRPIALPFLPGKLALGADYLNEMALPNFYFHITTAYAILRHGGVSLGKFDYIGSVKLRDA